MDARRQTNGKPLDDDFPAFYAERSRGLLLFFARRTFDAESAFDLTAETFAQALSSKRHYRGTTDEEAAAWLYGIARHVLLRFFRKGKAERRALALLGVELPTVTEDQIERIEQLADLEVLRLDMADALKDLNEDQRHALELRVVRELSYAEVAMQLEISEESARARVSRGLRALAERFDRSTFQEEAP